MSLAVLVFSFCGRKCCPNQKTFKLFNKYKEIRENQLLFFPKPVKYKPIILRNFTIVLIARNPQYITVYTLSFVENIGLVPLWNLFDVDQGSFESPKMVIIISTVHLPIKLGYGRHHKKCQTSTKEVFKNTKEILFWAVLIFFISN